MFYSDLIHRLTDQDHMPIPTPAEKEQQFHAILVRCGLRPEGSTLEQYRAKPVQGEAVAVDLIGATGRRSEAAE